MIEIVVERQELEVLGKQGVIDGILYAEGQEE